MRRAGLTEARAAGTVPPRKRLKVAAEEKSASTASNSTAPPAAAGAQLEVQAPSGGATAARAHAGATAETVARADAAVRGQPGSQEQARGEERARGSVSAADAQRQSSASDVSDDARVPVVVALESTPTSATTIPAPPLLTRKPSRCAAPQWTSSGSVSSCCRGWVWLGFCG